jgi:hypothetical protein
MLLLNLCNLRNLWISPLKRLGRSIALQWELFHFAIV